MGLATPSQYATPQDFANIGVLPSFQGSLTAAQQTEALQAASVFMDGYLGQVFTLPLVTWDYSLIINCSWIAAYYLIQARGYNPNNPAEATFETRYQMAYKWLKDISSGVAIPMVTDSSPNAQPGVHAPATKPGVVTPSRQSWDTWSRGW